MITANGLPPHFQTATAMKRTRTWACAAPGRNPSGLGRGARRLGIRRV